MGWIQEVTTVLPGQVIGIDGKKLRRSHDRRPGKNAIHMVSAWATANHWVLGQRKWMLDIAFGDADYRIRKDHAPENFARPGLSP